MLDITAIILTYNEELHIKRCLDNLQDIAKYIVIVDCFSSDKTLEIATSYPNVIILKNKWVNYATQFNWALENAEIKTKWILRIDSDEYLSADLKDELNSKLDTLDENISGVVFRRRHIFMGRIIKRGMPTVRLLRLFKYGKAKCEVRQMDEHIQIYEGDIINFKNYFYDANLNNISWWTNKHIGYAIREAADLLDTEYGLSEVTSNGKNININGQARKKRKIKNKYSRLPLFGRSFAYFIYRYIFKLGFIEGKAGFMWHFFQGWWYRSLVDAKIYEIKKACDCDPEKIKAYLLSHYNIRL